MWPLTSPFCTVEITTGSNGAEKGWEERVVGEEVGVSGGKWSGGDVGLMAGCEGRNGADEKRRRERLPGLPFYLHETSGPTVLR